MGDFRQNARARPDRRRGSSNRLGGRSGGRRFGNRDSEGSSERGPRGGGGRSFGGRDSGRRPPQMFDVICDKCGKECEVPFRPTEGKPVFCRECFDKKESSFSPRDRDSRPVQSAQSGMSQEQFNQINAKLDKILEFLENLEVEYTDEDSEEK